jgi:hypothetical protein
MLQFHPATIYALPHLNHHSNRSILHSIHLQGAKTFVAKAPRANVSRNASRLVVRSEQTSLAKVRT